MESDVFHSQAVAVEDNDYLKTMKTTTETDMKTTTTTDTKTNTKIVSTINIPRSEINVQVQVQQGEVQPFGSTTHRQDKKTLAKEDSRNPLEDDIEGWLQAHQNPPLILSYATERAVPSQSGETMECSMMMTKKHSC